MNQRKVETEFRFWGDSGSAGKMDEMQLFSHWLTLSIISSSSATRLKSLTGCSLPMPGLIRVESHPSAADPLPDIVTSLVAAGLSGLNPPQTLCLLGRQSGCLTAAGPSASESRRQSTCPTLHTRPTPLDPSHTSHSSSPSVSGGRGHSWSPVPAAENNQKALSVCQEKNKHTQSEANACQCDTHTDTHTRTVSQQCGDKAAAHRQRGRLFGLNVDGKRTECQ